MALALLLIITLLFLVIPFNNLRNDDDDEKDEKLFEDYVDRFNKSYRRNLTEYSKRYKHFRVSFFTRTLILGNPTPLHGNPYKGSNGALQLSL